MADDSFGKNIKPINVNDFNGPTPKTPKVSVVDATKSSQPASNTSEADLEKIMGPSDISMSSSNSSLSNQKPGFSKNFSDANVQSSVVGDASKKSKSSNPKKKWIIAGIIVAVLVVLAGIGYLVFTNPNFVWWYGMTRTNKAINKIVDAQVEPAKLQSYSTSSINGTANASWLGNTLNGSVSSVFNSTTNKTDVNLDVKSITQKTNKFNLQLISQVPSGSTYPNIYFNISGLSALGIDKMVPQLSQYQGKWIVINGSLLSSMISSDSKQSSSAQQPSSSDFSSFVTSAAKITSDYLFTTNKNMAVFQKQSYVGKQTINGVSSYHYNVSINKANANNYCQAIFTEVYASGLWQKMSNQGQNAANLVEKSKANSIKSCQNSVNNNKNTYEMWIDANNHIVNQIRVNDGGNTQTYTDIGQIVQSGNSIEFYVDTVDTKAKSDFKATVTLSNNSDDISGKVAYSSKGTAPVNVNLSLSSKPSNGAVQVTIPTNAIPITDVLSALGLSTPSTSVTPTTPATPTAAPKASN